MILCMLPCLVFYVLIRFFYFYYVCRFQPLRRTLFLQYEAWVDFSLGFVSPKVKGKMSSLFIVFLYLLFWDYIDVNGLSPYLQSLLY